MVKGIKTLGLMAILCLVMIALPSPAHAILSWHTYDDNAKTATIYDNVFFSVAKIQLVENTPQCLINCYSLIRITPLKDIEASSKTADYNFQFIDKKGQAVNMKSFDAYTNVTEEYKIEVQDTKPCEIPYPDDILKYNPDLKDKLMSTTCPSGTHKETRTREVWNKFDMSKASFKDSKDIYVRLEATKTPLKSIDWIPTFYGVEIDEMAWWSTSWAKKKPVNVTSNNGSTVFANYTVGLPITWDADMNADFSDLRFVNGSENTELGYWIENYTASTSAWVWVKVDQVLPASPTNYTIYMYYSNAGVSSTSSGEGTFLLFDNFTGTSMNTTKWGNHTVSTSTTTQNEVLNLNNFAGGGCSGASIYSKDNFMKAYGISVNYMYQQQSANDGACGGGKCGGEALFVLDKDATRATPTYSRVNNKAALNTHAPQTTITVPNNVGTYNNTADQYTGTLENAPSLINGNWNRWQYSINSTGWVWSTYNYSNTGASTTNGQLEVWDWNNALGTLIAIDFTHDGFNLDNIAAVDNVTVRPFVRPEPTGVFGTEETVGMNVTLNSPSADLQINNTRDYIFNFTGTSPTDTTFHCNLTLDAALNQTNWTVLNGTLTDWATVSGLSFGQHNWTVYCNDSMLGTALRQFSINDTIEVGLNYPLNQTEIQNTRNYIFNITGNHTQPSTISCNLTIDNTLNQTNYTTLNNTLTNFNVTGLNWGQHNWTSECNYTTQTATTGLRFFSMNDTFAPNVTLISPNGNISGFPISYNFTCNVSDIGLANTSLWWNYNGTWGMNGSANIFTAGTTSNQTYFTRTSVSNDTTWNCLACEDHGNYSCSFAAANYSLGTMGFNISSGSCPAGYVAAQNYTFADENNPATALTDETVAIDFQFGSSTNNTLNIYNISFTDISYFTICINASAAPYYIGYAEIQYSQNGYALRRFFNFVNSTLTTTQLNTTLYSLAYSPGTGTSTSISFSNSSNYTTTTTTSTTTVVAATTSIQFQFTTMALSPYVGYYAKLLRWYPTTAAYTIVDNGKTDSSGSTVMFLELNDITYRIGLYAPNGTLIDLESPSQFICASNPCTYIIRVAAGLNTEWQDIVDIQQGLSLSQTTGIWTYIWNDPSLKTTTMNFSVFKRDGLRDTLICNTTGAGATGVMTCNVSSYAGMDLVAFVYRTASPATLVATGWARLISTDVFGSSIGLFISVLFLIFMITLGVSVSPIVGIVMGIVGIIPAMMLHAVEPAFIIIIGMLGLMAWIMIKKGVT